MEIKIKYLELVGQRRGCHATMVLPGDSATETCMPRKIITTWRWL